MTVEIYTQPWCPYCERAMALLDAKGVAYKEIKAAQGTPARQEAMQRSGRSSVPQIFIGAHHVGGSDDLVALERSGRLDGERPHVGAGAESGVEGFPVAHDQPTGRFSHIEHRLRFDRYRSMPNSAYPRNCLPENDGPPVLRRQKSACNEE